MTDCNIDDEDCVHDWNFLGSLEGECLTYSAGDRDFLRDAELRISIFGNDSGNGLRLILVYIQHIICYNYSALWISLSICHRLYYRLGRKLTHAWL